MPHKLAYLTINNYYGFDWAESNNLLINIIAWSA